MRTLITEPLARGLRGFSASLYATERHPLIQPRTNVVFHRFSSENTYGLSHIPGLWISQVRDRRDESTDEKIQTIFLHLEKALQRLKLSMRNETIGDQGQELYWITNSFGNIEAVAYGREFNGCANICVYNVCINPNRIPDSFERINRSPLEGYDSALIRAIVRCALSMKLDSVCITAPEIMHSGYKNLFSQGNIEIDDFCNSICEPPQTLLHAIHGQIGFVT